MTSSWITHVRDYASKHGISYKKALTEAKASYKTGGKVEVEVEKERKGYAFDIPLLIRIMEWSREDAKSDMDLHDVAERVQRLNKAVLTMKDYRKLVSKSKKGAGDIADTTL